jgi:Mg2+ and Co2+ transporter CorA
MVLHCVIRCYREGLRSLQHRSDEFEDNSDVVAMISGMTGVQKQVAVYLRCLGATKEMLNDVISDGAAGVALPPGVLDACNHSAGTVISLTDLATEVNENASSSINMQMALDGFRASVNMKIFTYMSVLLQPVAVATGWYGMNFDNMPDLLYEDSYFVFMGIVGGVVFLLSLWLIYRSCIASR